MSSAVTLINVPSVVAPTILVNVITSSASSRPDTLVSPVTSSVSVVTLTPPLALTVKSPKSVNVRSFVPHVNVLSASKVPSLL